MTHYHDHHCYHDLRYCSVCDKCYCTKCSREWGKYYATWTYPCTFGSSSIGGNFQISGIAGFNSSNLTGDKMNAVASTTDSKQTVEVHTHQEQKK